MAGSVGFVPCSERVRSVECPRHGSVLVTTSECGVEGVLGSTHAELPLHNKRRRGNPRSLWLPIVPMDGAPAAELCHGGYGVPFGPVKESSTRSARPTG